MGDWKSWIQISFEMRRSSGDTTYIVLPRNSIGVLRVNSFCLKGSFFKITKSALNPEAWSIILNILICFIASTIASLPFPKIFHKSVDIFWLQMNNEIKIPGSPWDNVQAHRNAAGQHVGNLISIQSIRNLLKKFHHRQASSYSNLRTRQILAFRHVTLVWFTVNYEKST